MLVLALALLGSSAGDLYGQMRADTLDKGRQIESVVRASFVWLGPRVDECVLVAAPNDQDWEGEYLQPDGTRLSVKAGLDSDGKIAFLSIRPRVDLPDDPHAGDKPIKVWMPIVDRPLVPFSGGPTRMWNQHVYNPDQRHAIDVVGWRDGGSYGSSLGEHNEDYIIWDAPIRSPVDGTVVEIENDAEDHQHPQAQWSDDAHPFGNHVVIRINLSNPERFLVLGHMKKGSVRVEAGQTVKAGDLIGRVGNSGNSSEPHLHVHIQDGPILKTGFSVPFVVNNKPVLRGSFLDAKDR